MCGLAGIIGLDSNGSVPPHFILEMCDRMAHRGPDGEGFLLSQHAGNEVVNQIRQERPEAHLSLIEAPRLLSLGHRRLSIIDLDTVASQPMQDVSERYWLVYNGEVYNRAELRVELEQKGYKFRTNHSDSEVIINAYAEWGKECVHRFRGMFAFVIYDTEEDTALLVRDRSGIKPFYYAVKDGVLRFGSEIKTILVDPKISREFNPQAVYDYLTFLAIAAPRTIFKSINKMPPAHYMEMKKGQLSDPIRYWSPLDQEEEPMSEKEIMEGILEELENSARYRMEGDVDYGVLLSGGVDSSANLRMLSRQVDNPIKAFSIGFDDKFPGYQNEFPYSRKVAKQFGAEYHELMLSPEEFNDFFPKMVWYQDEPIADTANIPIYYIAKKARETGVTVLLGGEGSDELLIGYTHWRLAYQFYHMFEKPNARMKTSMAKFLHSFPVIKNKRPLYRDWYPKMLKGQTVFWGGSEWGNETMKDSMISHDLKTSLKNYSSYQSIEPFYKEFKASKRDNYLDWMTYLDLSYRLPELLLARLDRMTMAASVEGRVPFMDHKFIELCMRIPADLKIKGKTEKYLLKKAFEGILPNDILYRPKEGFPVPLNSILFTDDFTAQAKVDITEFNKSLNLFDNAYLHRLFKEGRGKEFWNVMNLALWYKAVA